MTVSRTGDVEGVKPLRAASYPRVSDEEQVDGTSLDTQEIDNAAYIAAQGMICAGVYREEGVSGTVLDRPMLQRMLADFDRGLFDVVVVWKRDRLARNKVVVAEFERRGIPILSVTETNSDGSAAGEFSQDVLDAVAAFQSRRIGETVRRAMRRRAEQGYFNGGSAPRGFDIDGGVLVPNDDMPLVLRMFRERDAGMSKAAIRDGLMDDGLMIDNTGIRRCWPPVSISGRSTSAARPSPAVTRQ
jgi:site-specific DNA recombinase